MCDKSEWHRINECEDTNVLKARQFRKVKSDLFSPQQYELPPPQKQAMRHNSTLPFLRLPPEIRRRIYELIFGGQSLWFGYSPEKRKWNYVERDGTKPYFSTVKEKFHRGGSFEFLGSSLTYVDLRVLRMCREVYMEAALLPYWLNDFFFEDDLVRRRFEKSARVGKRKAQKRAVGRYELMGRTAFEVAAVESYNARSV